MSIDNLPKIIPIFPLNGALLLPQGNLPLNIFEPRYLSMIDYAMKSEKMIGMIQKNNKSGENDELDCGGFWDLAKDMYLDNQTGMEQDSIYYLLVDYYERVKHNKTKEKK